MGCGGVVGGERYLGCADYTRSDDLEMALLLSTIHNTSLDAIPLEYENKSPLLQVISRVTRHDLVQQQQQRQQPSPLQHTPPKTFLNDDRCAFFGRQFIISPTTTTTTIMIHPIQRIHAHPASDRVYTATSNVLHVFRRSTGELLSTWTAPLLPPNPNNQPSSSAAATPPNAQSPEKAVEGGTPAPASPAPPSSPSSKKRKLGDAAAAESKKLRTSKWTNSIGGCNNAVTKMETTVDGRYLVVATSEDKAIRVFKVSVGEEDGAGGLEMLSTR